jgi:hypothetical protein
MYQHKTMYCAIPGYRVNLFYGDRHNPYGSNRRPKSPRLCRWVFKSCYVKCSTNGMLSTQALSILLNTDNVKAALAAVPMWDICERSYPQGPHVMGINQWAYGTSGIGMCAARSQSIPAMRAVHRRLEEINDKTYDTQHRMFVSKCRDIPMHMYYAALDLKIMSQNNVYAIEISRGLGGYTLRHINGVEPIDIPVLLNKLGFPRTPSRKQMIDLLTATYLRHQKTEMVLRYLSDEGVETLYKLVCDPGEYKDCVKRPNLVRRERDIRKALVSDTFSTAGIY